MIDTSPVKSPEDYGCTLHINKPALFDVTLPVSLDVETDEQDNFAGLALCQSEKDVYFYDKDQWCDEFADFLGSFTYVMQSGAFDIRMIKKWGVKTDYSKLAYDTKIMAYTMDSTLTAYGLKPMAKEWLGLEWQTYKEMVGKGKKKTTLDQQPAERVAKYCGMDTFATYKLYKYLWKRMSEKQHEYYNTIEMPLYRLLSMTEDKGVELDVPYLQELHDGLVDQAGYWEDEIKRYGDFNPRSPKQLLKVFRANGLKIASTDVKTLGEHKDKIIVKELLEYRKYKKLYSTYSGPFLKSFSLPRLHGRFLQKTITGRLASSTPNLQNIPSRTEEGKKIRKAFIAKPGHKLLVADYSQIEYRLFAHFTQDPTLLNVYKNNIDIHTQTTAIALEIAINKVTKEQRAIGKTLNFASIYGAQGEKIAETLGIPAQEGIDMLERYWDGLSTAACWISKVKFMGARNGGVETMFGRFIPLPDLSSKNLWTKRHAERVAVNAIIQGTAAELIKMAMLNIHKALNLVPVLQVHDELVYELPDEDIKELGHEIIKYMESVVDIGIPLEVSAEIGTNWADAK